MTAHHGHDDFAFEPVRGLPETLPEGEAILWQGVPAWRSLARRVFHTRKIAFYVTLLLLWQGATTLHDGGSFAMAAVAVLMPLPLALGAVAIPALLAWGSARSTVYTITNKRVVIRSGIALDVTVNLPLAKIETLSKRLHRDGSGDIPMTLAGDGRIAYLALWPNARPWRLARPQPMLRCLAEPEAVAELLVRALIAAQAATGLETVEGESKAKPTAEQPRSAPIAAAS
ncbi:photosynthetic complex putative assembly protein PuhB [Pelagibius sp.]|uniref:photosynthetic complex putative assembly protein PuhB n=1 Tax=Pelagibius sp. TaxID=1931238 RepID=UPI003B508E13